MAYAGQQLKVTWIFRIENTEEVGITSVSITGAAYDAVPALAAAVGRSSGTAMLGAMSTFMVTTGLQWAAYSQLTDVKIAALDTAGHYLTDADITSDATPESGLAQQVLPQSSVVGSLRTASTLGDANYGRMYLPHTKLELPTDLPTANSTVTGLVSVGFAGFLGAVNDEFNQGPEPGVVSIMSFKGAGLSKGVTRSAIGSVTDTQRRRRNRLTEVYSFSDVAI